MYTLANNDLTVTQRVQPRAWDDEEGLSALINPKVCVPKTDKDSYINYATVKSVCMYVHPNIDHLTQRQRHTLGDDEEGLFASKVCVPKNSDKEAT